MRTTKLKAAGWVLCVGFQLLGFVKDTRGG